MVNAERNRQQVGQADAVRLHSLRDNFNGLTPLDGRYGRPCVLDRPDTLFGRSNAAVFSVNAEYPEVEELEADEFLNAGVRVLPSPLTDGSINFCVDQDTDLTETYAVFPTSTGVPVNLSYAVEWDGVLPGTNRRAGRVTDLATDLAEVAVRPVEASVARLGDAGADYCAADVRPGDVVTFDSCILDTDCGDVDRFTCLKPSRATWGLSASG